MSANLQVIHHQTVEQMVVVLAQSAEIEVFVYWGLLESQLCQASCLLDLVALDAGGSQAVGSEVLANVRRVCGIIESFPITTTRSQSAIGHSARVSKEVHEPWGRIVCRSRRVGGLARSAVETVSHICSWTGGGGSGSGSCSC